MKESAVQIIGKSRKLQPTHHTIRKNSRPDLQLDRENLQVSIAADLWKVIDLLQPNKTKPVIK